MVGIEGYYEDNPNVKVITNLDDIGQPYSCQQWGDRHQFYNPDVYPLMTDDGNQDVIWSWLNTGGAFPSTAYIDHTMTVYFKGNNAQFGAATATIDSMLDECGDLCTLSPPAALFDYEIDGAVLKVNNYNFQDQLGSTNKAPRWAIAIKFAEEEVDTVINNIQFQIGRTGTITPVAQLEPVKLSGATITNATLHNMDEIERLSIKIGDKVKIKRAGEVIPKIIKCSETYPHSKSIKIPTHCPCCNTILIQAESEVALKCTNNNCHDQVKARISHYVSRNAMDIDGLGESIIDILLQEKLISDISDLYHLNKEELIKLDRFAEKSTENLLNAIQKSKEKPLENLIFALGIPYVGKVAATILAEKYGNLSDILKASIEELTNIDNIGEKIAKSIHNTTSNERFMTNWSSLKDNGINPTHTPISDGPLNGKSFLITGTLSQKRQDIESEIKSLGGNIANTVSKKLNYLIVGENPGSKLEKAEKLIEKNTPILIINEKQLNKILENK